MPEKQGSRATTRRNVLSAFAGTGVAAVLPSVGSARADAADGAVAASTSSTGAADQTDAVPLGTFESDLDEWAADGDVELSRVARRDRPFAVTEGEFGLVASVGREQSPAIARPVETVDLAARPYLVADAAPGRIEGTDAPVAFRFLLREPAGGTEDREPVAASDPVLVRQAAPGRLFWDASGVDADLLDSAARLGIEWAAAGDGTGGTGATDDGVAGDDASTSTDPDADATLDGEVVFDAVRASASPDVVARAKLVATMQDLQFEHGTYVRTEVTDESADAEAGEFVFADGATEPYQFEVLGDDHFRLTLAGTVVEFGGGWF